MKRIGIFRLAFAFGGCFLGAGYVSGQEMWQFFGQYGRSGVLGLLLALLLLSFIGAITFFLSRRLGTSETDLLIVGNRFPILNAAVFLLEAAFLFCVCIIMTAGVGALCDEVFGIPVWIGCAVFSAVVVVISFSGFSGLVTAFSATVPILIIITLYFGLRTVISGDIVLESTLPAQRNTLLRSWPLAAVLFTCYNVFGSIAILAPLGQHIKNDKTVIGGIAVGAVILLAVALSVLFSVSSAGTQDSELPMLTMAMNIGKPFGIIYGILLLLAMFGTCLSCLVAFIRTVSDKWKAVSLHRIPFHLGFTLLIFLGSLFGFGDLIGVIYPVFGYCSSLFIILLIVHFFRTKRKSGS